MSSNCGQAGQVASLLTSVPFTSGEGGYHTYRIPALTWTANGALIAFAEGRRHSPADHGDIDIVCRRSADGGLSWGPQQVVTQHGTDTAGNPCVVVDPASGDVVLLSCRNRCDTPSEQIRAGRAPARRVYVQRSADDGASWSEPVEITDQVRASWMRWYATGPGAGVAISQGEHAGRLVVPACHSRTPSGADTGAEKRYYGAHCIYSDDGGYTWQLGFTSSNPNGYLNENETAVVELPDGRLYFNCRDQYGAAPGTRADAYSADGGRSLMAVYRPQATISTPVVHGSLLAMGGVLVYSGPTSPMERAAMGVWVSTDTGLTWRRHRQVSGLPAAYSAMVQLASMTVGLLYETGDFSPYSRIEFTHVLGDGWHVGSSVSGCPYEETPGP